MTSKRYSAASARPLGAGIPSLPCGQARHGLRLPSTFGREMFGCHAELALWRTGEGFDLLRASRLRVAQRPPQSLLLAAGTLLCLACCSPHGGSDFRLSASR